VNVQDIDLNLLRVFDAVLHERGVTPAAGRLGLTQPAVSNALARLRALFGDPLFLRTPGGMDATPFARELAGPVRQALALLESALAHGPGFDPATSARAFRFYMSDLGQIEFLPPLVERVQHEAPGVRLEAAGLDVEDIAAALAGISRRIALRVPHFTVVPMVLERTDLILTLPARVARVYEKRGNFKSLPPPVPIPQADVGVHWHERFEADAGNRWLREQIVELFREK
jgi:DNA-binding transcriptional LysR family regulator